MEIVYAIEQKHSFLTESLKMREMSPKMTGVTENNLLIIPLL